MGSDAKPLLSTDLGKGNPSDHTPGHRAILGTPRDRTKPEFDTFRNRLVGTQSPNTETKKGKTVEGTFEHGSVKPKVPRIGEMSKSSANTTNSSGSGGTGSISRRSHELRQLGTQEEEHQQQCETPGGRTPGGSTNDPESEKRELANHLRKHEQSLPLAVKESNTDTNMSAVEQHHTDKTISYAGQKKNVTKHRSIVFTLDGTNQDENISPSQTPSTSSSAMLSLPMNHLFVSSQPSFDGSISPQKREGISQNHQISIRAPVRNDSDAPADTSKLKKPDPLRDIEFWQQMVEKEEAGSKKNGSKSFKHTVASLVVAKNPSGGGSSNHRNHGFLWLPSILEGGLAHTGLLEE
jgi:hypothetical protein